MKADRRFTFAAIALFCITCAGTTMALVSMDGPIGAVDGGHQDLEALRPSLTTLPERFTQRLPQGLPETAADPSDAAGPRPIDRSLPEPEAGLLAEPVPALRPPLSEHHARLAFIDPGVGSIELPDEPVTVAGTPESWSVEVKELPITASRLKQSSPKTRARAAKKSRKTRYTLKQRLAEISPSAMTRIKAKFDAAKAAWPPAEIALVAIKDERALELYSRPQDGEWKFVHRYKVLAASGARGPKLLRGDKQVPEGVYRISYLNPNSAYHVSLRVNYPNAFDREMAKKDGRKDLGGDIMIHGKNVSAGCLAVGDRSAEELFVLAAEAGMKNIKVVIAPTDFRKKPPAEVLTEASVSNAPAKAPTRTPEWLPQLYTEIASAMTDFKSPPPPPSLMSLLGL